LATLRKEIGTDKIEAPDKATFMKEREDASKQFYEKADKIFSKQQDQLKSDKEVSVYMAMIKGGFAAAAGKSPYALANIAEGGKEGISSLEDSFKEFRKAAQEQNKMELELEKARAADKRGDLDAYQRATEKADERKDRRNDRYAAGVTSIITQQMQNETQRAVAGANSPLALYRELGGGDISKGLEKYAGIMGPEARGEYAILQQYAGPKGEIALRMLEGGSPEQKAYAAQIRAKLATVQGGGFVQPPTGATVLPPK
jgi:hypothetical protein